MNKERELLFKLMIFEVLLKDGYNFYNKEKTIIFYNSLGIFNIQNEIIFNKNIYFISRVIMPNNFLNNKLDFLVKELQNNYSSILKCYLQKEGDLTLFCIEAVLPLNKFFNNINKVFWKEKIDIHLGNLCYIINFLYSIDSEVKETDLKLIKKFKRYMNKYLRYLDEVPLDKQQIKEEIDRELDNYIKGKKHLRKLNKLTNILLNLNK